MADLLTIKNISTSVIRLNPDHLAEANKIGWQRFGGWCGYPEQKTLSFEIHRQGQVGDSSPASHGVNMCKYANCIRRYINARTEVLVLDFIPNHEQKGPSHVVAETGEFCLINEIRIALNGVLARQVAGQIYEMHVVNDTPVAQGIFTESIIRKGSKPSDVWHGDFAPSIRLGQIEPGSTLHISQIYMRPGRVFTDELLRVEAGEIVPLPDSTIYMHNGLAQWALPDMIDEKTTEQLRDPLTEGPYMARIGFHPQPYTDPMDITMRALEQLLADLSAISKHAHNASALADKSATDYGFDNIVITVTDDNLICRLNGFDESIGLVIASNAGYLEPQCTHYSSHWVHQTKKESIVRVSCPNVMDIFIKAIELAIARTENAIAQFADRRTGSSPSKKSVATAVKSPKASPKA